MYSTSIGIQHGFFSFRYTNTLLIESFFERRASFSPNSTGEFGNFLYEQIQQYFEEGTPLSVVPIQPSHTIFRQKVFEKIVLIPHGETRTYTDILGKNYARSVGSALAQNTCALWIPCHRVQGGKNPFAFRWGSEWKQFLLEHEKKYSIFL